MKKLKTISIGMPAYNEEETISTVIKLLLSQKNNYYKLENIIVTLDGSTDNTFKKVQSLARHHKEIVILNNKERLGKSMRLNQLFQKNQSDILIIIDADLFITDKNLLDKLVSRFSDPYVGLVSANNLAHKTKQFWGRVWGAAENIWYYSRRNYNNGNNMYNTSGASFAVEKNFAKKIILPQDTIDEWRVIYANTFLQKKEFVFVDDAITYFTPPSTLGDIKKLYARSSERTDHTLKDFLSQYSKFTRISRKNIILGTIQYFFKDPFYTLIAMSLLKVLPFIKIEKDYAAKNGVWEIISSTKKGHQLA